MNDWLKVTWQLAERRYIFGETLTDAAISAER